MSEQHTQPAAPRPPAADGPGASPDRRAADVADSPDHDAELVRQARRQAAITVAVTAPHDRPQPATRPVDDTVAAGAPLDGRRHSEPADAQPRASVETALLSIAEGAEETVAGDVRAARGAARQSPPGGPPADSEGVWASLVPGYTIHRKLSGGGQGVVYEATQHSTKRKVAVKIVRGGAFAHPEHRARIERGIRILGQLNHPNIVRVIDSGVITGALYYSMEYVKGLPLDDYIALQRSTSFEVGLKGSGAAPAGRLRDDAAPPAPNPLVPSSQASRRPAVESSRAQRQLIRRQLTLFAGICEAIEAAHVRGVIHRDLKPGNILVDERGEPHILDFDLAKLLGGDIDDEPEAGPMTATGEFLGSLRWASPEQVERKPGSIDLRTDIYALGVMLYEILTGQSPYPVIGTRREIEDNILYAEPARPRTIRRLLDHDLETIVLKCLAKDRARRYRSAGDLAADLRACLNGDPIAAKRDSHLYVIWKTAWRHPVITLTLSCCAAIVMLALVVSSLAWQDAERERRRADRQAQTMTHLARESEELAGKIGLENIALKRELARLRGASEQEPGSAQHDADSHPAGPSPESSGASLPSAPGATREAPAGKEPSP